MIGALVTSAGKSQGAVVSALRWASVTDEQVDPLQMFKNMNNEREAIVKLRQGSGKDRQGMALKAKGLKA